MDFINAHWLASEVVALPLAHPRAVVPLVVALVLDDRRGARMLFHLRGERIGLYPQRALAREHLELVECTRLDLRHEQLPHPGAPEHAHREDAAVPTAEVADHA